MPRYKKEDEEYLKSLSKEDLLTKYLELQDKYALLFNAYWIKPRRRLYFRKRRV